MGQLPATATPRETTGSTLAPPTATGAVLHPGTSCTPVGTVLHATPPASPQGQFSTLTAPRLAGAALHRNPPHTAGLVLYHDTPLHAEAAAAPPVAPLRAGGVSALQRSVPLAPRAAGARSTSVPKEEPAPTFAERTQLQCQNRAAGVLQPGRGRDLQEAWPAAAGCARLPQRQWQCSAAAPPPDHHPCPPCAAPSRSRRAPARPSVAALRVWRFLCQDGQVFPSRCPSSSPAAAQQPHGHPPVPGPSRQTHGFLHACSHLGDAAPCSENHETPHLPFFRTTSSDSGLRLTETTFITRWFPPCRIKETTCLCPTFTTLTPFT